MLKHLTLFPTNPPITLTWEDDVPAPEPRLTHGEVFVCDTCGAVITRASLRVAVDGSHRHLLPRSFGAAQEHGCFTLAPGCRVHAPLNLLLDKETGSQWRPVSCAACGAAMGWYHASEAGPAFFLLILENLRAADETGESGTSGPSAG